MFFNGISSLAVTFVLGIHKNNQKSVTETTQKCNNKKSVLFSAYDIISFTF
jgi:hypothetical protein